MMPQSARILTTACPKPAVPLEDCQREFGRVTRFDSPQRSRYMVPSSFPPSCAVQRPGFSIGSRSGYWSGFANAACAPSLASNGKTTCRTKKSSKEPACPAWSLSCFRCSCAVLATSQGWKTYACPKQSSSASSKKESAIMVLQESVTKISRRVSLHRWVLAIRNGSRRRQTETAGAHQ